MRVSAALAVGALLLSYAVDAAQLDLLVEQEAAGANAAFALPDSSPLRLELDDF